MDRAASANEFLKKEVEVYKELQRDIAKNHRARQQFTQQQNECDMVMKELGLLEDGSDVFKLVGPVLVRQDLTEAKSNVSKRLEFIGTELKRLDNTLAAYNEKKSKKEQEIMRLQTDLQKMQGAS